MIPYSLLKLFLLLKLLFYINFQTILSIATRHLTGILLKIVLNFYVDLHLNQKLTSVLCWVFQSMNMVTTFRLSTPFIITVQFQHTNSPMFYLFPNTLYFECLYLVLHFYFSPCSLPIIRKPTVPPMFFLCPSWARSLVQGGLSIPWDNHAICKQAQLQF